MNPSEFIVRLRHLCRTILVIFLLSLSLSSVGASSSARSHSLCASVFLPLSVLNSPANPDIESLAYRLLTRFTQLDSGRHGLPSSYRFSSMGWHRDENLVEIAIHRFNRFVGRGHFTLLSPKEVRAQLRLTADAIPHREEIAKKIFQTIKETLPFNGILILKNIDNHSNRSLEDIGTNGSGIKVYPLASPKTPVRTDTNKPRIVSLLHQSGWQKIIALERPNDARTNRPYILVALKSRNHWAPIDFLNEVRHHYNFKPPLRILYPEKVVSDLNNTNVLKLKWIRYRNHLTFIEPFEKLAFNPHELIDAIQYSQFIPGDFVFIPSFRGSNLPAFDGVVVFEDGYRSRVSLKRFPVIEGMFEQNIFNEFLFRELEKMKKYSNVLPWVTTSLNVQEEAPRVVFTESRLRAYRKAVSRYRTVLDFLGITVDPEMKADGKSRIVIRLDGEGPHTLDAFIRHLSNLKAQGLFIKYAEDVDQIVVMDSNRVISLPLSDGHW